MKWLTQVVTLLVVIISCQGLGDPYKILGLHRSASLPEIRKAYKQLAKEWHPDKNSDPDAENKFVEINQAYELLTDPERRKNYDNFGYTEPLLRNKRDYSQYRKFDPLDDLFGGGFGGFSFNFNDGDNMATLHRWTVTTRGYENKLVPKSYRVPHLLFFYSDWCVSCVQVEPIWRKVIEELEPLGLGIAAIHAENEQLLIRKVGVSSLPSLAVLIEGKPSIFKESVFSKQKIVGAFCIAAIHAENEQLLIRKVGVSSLPSLAVLIEGKPSIFKESVFSKQKIVDFVRSRFPYRLIQSIDDTNIDSFLKGWTDNRVRVLIFDRQEIVRLRYLLMAYYYRDRVAFGYVYLKSPHTVNVRKRFKVPVDIDTLSLFNENIDNPAASLSMSDMPVKTMQDIINSNKYLLLPRLSSQNMFDALCPPEWTRTKKRLCVVLVSQNTPVHDEARQALRQFAQDGSYKAEKVRFAYIFQEKQTEFVNAIAGGCPSEPVLHIVIIWRRDANHIKYEWLPHSWDTTQIHNWNETKDRLERTIQRLLHDSEALSYEAVVKDLIDEHAQGLVSRFINKVFNTIDFLKENVSKHQLLPVVSVLITVVFVIGFAYFMAHLVKMEEERIQMQNMNSASDGFGNNFSNSPRFSSELRLHELRGETYNGLIRLLKPGCRTLILLVDAESKTKLIPIFHKIVWPYRKNKTLMFGFMCLERGLDWYKQLLTLTLSEPRDLNINPRNCVGTVLSLNGHRRYFCMYHAKHPECRRAKGSKRLVKMTKHMSNGPKSKDGAFVGFDTSDSEETETSDIESGNRSLETESLTDKYSNVVFVSNLLDGLPNWLDRLFEGTTHRYYINYWPEMNTK